MKPLRSQFACLLFLLISSMAIAQTPPGVHALRDLEYVANGHERHRLDLYLPERASSPLPLILWVHGGGWSGGSKASPPALHLVPKGFAVASIHYRLSQHAIFPAQIHDCKAAVRWLRAHADQYGIDKQRIGAWGSSAGGQLVALMGTTNGVADLEGDEGNLAESSDVQAVVDWFGPTDFLTVGSKETRTKMLGGDAQSNRTQAMRASPMNYVSKRSVPFLIMHGELDKTVPIAQSEDFATALQKSGVEAAFVKVEGAGHGGRLFQSEMVMKQVEDFFVRHLMQQDSDAVSRTSQKDESISVGDPIVVRDNSALRDAIRNLKSGTTLKIAPGEYIGGHYIEGLKNITIEGLDPKAPPLIKGGSNAIHFSRCENLTLRHLRISEQTGNGLNLDDGGLFNQPVKGVSIENLEISNVGPTGNHDGIKCSGLDRLTIRDCSISGWGGQGIDMVGCHDSHIIGCRFQGKNGFSATAGVQTKGGCSNITIEQCKFVHAGERPLNVGGSTNLKLFRPVGANYEAKNILVKHCTIEGSSCAAAFVGVDGAEFVSNTILYPDKWIFRILQETNVDGILPCRNVLIQDNKIVFRRAQVNIEINVGAGTEPMSFQFKQNHWYAEDKPEASKPKLPGKEQGGIYGKNPL